MTRARRPGNWNLIHEIIQPRSERIRGFCFYGMSYKDKDKQRRYQRERCASRRREFFDGRACVRCGSTERLELDHRDPTLKVSHNVWSWSEKRMAIEIEKCQVLCYRCHKGKTAAEHRVAFTGRANTAQRKLSPGQAREASRLLGSGESERKVAARFGVGKTSIHSIKTHSSYRDVA